MGETTGISVCAGVDDGADDVGGIYGTDGAL
jgi:hypothetical protein